MRRFREAGNRLLHDAHPRLRIRFGAVDPRMVWESRFVQQLHRSRVHIRCHPDGIPDLVGHVGHYVRLLGAQLWDMPRVRTLGIHVVQLDGETANFLHLFLSPSSNCGKPLIRLLI